MRRIKVILAVVAAVTTMVVTAPAMAQTVFGSIGDISTVDSSFDGGGFIGSDDLSFSKR